jgi:hypothetical protein
MDHPTPFIPEERGDVKRWLFALERSGGVEAGEKCNYSILFGFLI